MTSKLDLRVSRKTVQQEVVEKLRNAILAGMFRPGDRLVEAALCSSLGVSRPSLREALRSLQAERLIEIVPNRGPQIPVLSWRDAEEIYEVRALLEGKAAALCAATVDDAGINALAAALETFRRAVKANDSAGQVRATAQFYGIILQGCGNKLIDDMLGSLLARINFLRERSMSLAGRAKKSYEEMNAIYAAIKKRDADKAQKAAQLHVMNAREAARKYFTVS